MIRLWRCEICGDPYVGKSAPDNCPFCGAHKQHIKLATEAQVTFDVPLCEKDKANVQHALEVEVSNATFYMCAAATTDDAEGKLLFKALGKIEAEHAGIWKKVLKLSDMPRGSDQCHSKNIQNLAESHAREERAIAFYKKAALESENERIRQLFTSLVDIENDHLHLSEERMRKHP